MYCSSKEGGETGVRRRKAGEGWREGRRKEGGEGRKKAEARRGIPTLPEWDPPRLTAEGRGALTDAKPEA